MTYRPYPNRDRALRQLDRHTQPVPPRQPTEFEQRMAQQANAALAAMSESLRPLTEKLVQAGAPRSDSLATQMLVVLDKGLKEEIARSAPGVLVMHKMVEAMRRRA